MAVAIPVISAIAGIGSTAYSIVSAENQKADAQTSANQEIIAQQRATIKAQIETIDLEIQAEKIKYQRVVDIEIRKQKFKNILVNTGYVILFLFGSIVIFKIIKSERRVPIR